jgi:hypothetical protein
MKSLEKYFKENNNNGIIDFNIRVSPENNGFRFYIHPDSKDGETLDYHVRENFLIPVGENIEERKRVFVTIADVETMTFGEAIMALKHGKKVARKGWNGKQMFVVYQKGYPQGIPCNKQTADAFGYNEGDLFRVNNYLQLKGADGMHFMWSPSTSDVLANDWYIVD